MQVELKRESRERMLIVSFIVNPLLLHRLIKFLQTKTSNQTTINMRLSSSLFIALKIMDAFAEVSLGEDRPDSHDVIMQGLMGISLDLGSLFDRTDHRSSKAQHKLRRRAMPPF